MVKNKPASQKSKDSQLSTIEAQITRAKLLLTRALKLAKAFERQKLGRRQKAADLSEEAQNGSRIVAEIQALKNIDVPSFAEYHLHKLLLKTKSVARSSLLPSTVRLAPYDLDAAGKNIVARLCNARVVKETTNTILSNIQTSLGVQRDTNGSIGPRKEVDHGRKEEISLSTTKGPPLTSSQSVLSELHEEGHQKDADDSDKASSQQTQQSEPVTYNLPNTSAFLPSLTAGGYWSGSESASDDDMVEEITQRKNRPGQRARRQLWEKKYGNNAKHIREGRSGHGTDRWDPRRGAVQGREPYQRRNFKSSYYDSRRNTKNDIRDTASVHDRDPDPMSKRPLHPSWEAARKRKQQMKATHKGEKIIFD